MLTMLTNHATFCDNTLLKPLSLDFFSGPVTRRPCSGVRPTTPHFLSASRPQTPQRPPSAHLLSGSSTFPESTICDEILPEDDSSDLTHGNGSPCASFSHIQFTNLSLKG